MSGKKSRQSLAPKPVTSSNSETLPLGLKIKKKQQQRRQLKLPHKASGMKTNERGSFGGRKS